MPKYSINKLKTFKAHEGMQGYSCTLLIDGKAACDIFEDCGGGPLQYTWLDLKNGRKQADEFFAYCKTLPPPEKSQCPDLEMDADQFIYDLVTEEIIAKSNARDAKKFFKKINAKLPSNKKGSWEVFNLPPTPENKARVLAKHPTAIFLDEHLADWHKIIQN